MGWLLLRFGWTLESANQIRVLGNSGLAPERVAASGRFSFPANLLEINPTQLERELSRELPVESVQVQRLAFPARLEVQMQARTPAARATRRIPGGIALGLVDAEGRWIEPDAGIAMPPPTTSVTVDGWTQSRSSVIASLLREQSRFNDSLRLIVLNPDGGIELHCERLGQIELGRDIGLLDRQIDAIEQLNVNLPKTLITGQKALIDLSNPERPEIQLPTKITS